LEASAASLFRQKMDAAGFCKTSVQPDNSEEYIVSIIKIREYKLYKKPAETDGISLNYHTLQSHSHQNIKSHMFLECVMTIFTYRDHTSSNKIEKDHY
jgi:hypothetical protein